MTDSLSKAALRRVLPMSRRGIILAAHGVALSWADRATELLHMPFDDFASIIILLRDLDFDFLTMEELAALSQCGFRRSKRWVHVSFDDGYQNIFDIAYPFLKERRIPFSLFVSTHHIESGDRFAVFWQRLAEELGLPLRDMFPEARIGEHPARELFDNLFHLAPIDEQDRIMKKIRAAIRKEHGDAILEAYYNDRPMRLADLKTMAADPLVHIGSHSHHHIAFHAGQDPAVGKENIEHSIHLLRDVWKVSEQPAFCFPHGDWTAEWASCLRHLGVPIAFPDAKGFVEDDMDPLLLPRFWMKSRDRMLGVLGMSLVGNRSLYAFGREPPPKLAARVQ